MDSNKMNRIVATKVMGYKLEFDTWQDANGLDTGMTEYFEGAFNPYNPTTNVAQAFEAVEVYCDTHSAENRQIPGSGMILELSGKRDDWVAVLHDPLFDGWKGEAATVAFAITEALVKAVCDEA